MMRSRKVWMPWLLLAACLTLLQAAIAAPYEIPFQGGTLTPEAGRFAVPAGERGHVLVQLNDYLHKGQREALAAAGVELLSYLPDRAYVARLRADINPAALKALGVRHLSPFPVQSKLHPRVTDGTFGPWSVYTQGRRIYAVEIMPDVTLAEAQAALEAAGCETGAWLEAAHTLLAAFSPERAREIAALDAVLFIDETPPPPEPINNVERERLHVNEVQAAPYNLNGDGVTILVYDAGMVDSTHADFDDRVTWAETGTVMSHSTHVAGTVGASGSLSSGTYRGMAPGTRIISGKYNGCGPYCLYESPNDFEADYVQARQVHHVELTTNSIGANIDANHQNDPSYLCAWMGDYETTSRLLDSLTRSCGGSPLIMFFAAGNERSGPGCGINNFNCLSVPAGAKNVITVGATNYSGGNDTPAWFSSFGPTDDGRVKPEVVALGIGVTSTVPGGYENMDGTSMACPAAAGVACLVLEKWHQMFTNAPDPLPETMKAMLINSATDLDQTGPDFKTGYGMVNALQAVENLTAGGVLESQLELEEHFTHTFSVPADLPALDVSLAWSDVPASVNVIPTLVNDLDLYLVDPTGATFRPWVLRANAPGVPAQTGRDSINICERVHVALPTAGQWTLHVTGRINSGLNQTFGLAANVALVEGWATVSGQIRDRGTSLGVPGRVSVIGEAPQLLTDDQGNYSIGLAGNRSYTIRAEAYSFATLDTLVALTTGANTLHFPLREAQNGTLNIHVVNQFNMPLAGAIVNFAFPFATIEPETTDAAGSIAAALPGTITYALTAAYVGVPGYGSAFVPENGTGTAVITIADDRFAPSGPDTYGYRVFETTDPGSSAIYDWLEISPQASGPGTAVPAGEGNDWVQPVNLPFPVTFYGQQQTQLQVGADGWVRVGPPQTADTLYRNIDIPNARVPNGCIFIFWDDLFPYDPTNGGDISYYHDTANGRFILEYHLVPHFSPRTNKTTAQLVIYNNTVRPTATGDNEFELQYQRLDYDDGVEDADASIGLEDYEGDAGLQLVYDGQYEAHCYTLGAGTALRFTTGAFGAVSGQVSVFPPVEDMTLITAIFGQDTLPVDAAGRFFADSVVAGGYAMMVSYPGYEIGHNPAVIVAGGDTATADFLIYRLDPPRDLAGAYDSSAAEIRLHWEWPLWHDIDGMPHGGGALDELAGFEVWDGGTRLATVPDTGFTYSIDHAGTYNFYIRAVYSGGSSDTSNHYRVDVTSGVDPLHGALPTTYYLKQNYPNPFNPQTRIEYGLPRAGTVKLEVFDILGRTAAVLVNEAQPAGIHTVTFNANGLATGVYYCRLQAGDVTRIQKMLLLR